VPKLTSIWGILIVIQGLLPVVIVYLTKLTIDSFVFAKNNHGDAASINQAVFWFILTGVVLLFTETFRYLGDWIRSAQAEHFSDYLKDLMHRKSAEVDVEVYDSSEYHDLLEQARGESQSKPLSLLENFGAVIQNFITLFSFAVILISYGWEISLLLVAGTLPGLTISLKYNRIFHRWWETTASNRRWLMYFDGMLSHGDAAAEMRLFDLSKRFRKKFQTLRQKLRSEKLVQLRQQLSGKLIGNILTLGTAGLAILWIGSGVYNNTATLGDLAVFYQVFSRGQSILGSLFGAIGQTIGNSLYLKNLFLFLDLPSKVVSPPSPTPFPQVIKYGIEFKGVTFSYPGEMKTVIRKFDLFVPAGRKAAIVGINGAGKSTLIKLICRFYDPQEGAIEIDNIDIRRFDVGELRRNISVLFQFPMRFQESSAENISFGDIKTAPKLENIEVAAKSAGAHDFISKLPDGYNALLGKWFVNGCELSGGEWQKVALARAYFRQAQIFVLDEPTSFMDSWGEVEWFDRFRNLSKNRTGLIITHRFTIAMRADIIHVMDDGRVIESGTHKFLVDMDGIYAESWKSQMQTAQEQNETEEDTHVLSETGF
jgi:ATP-binding cassette subfamily B protein